MGYESLQRVDIAQWKCHHENLICLPLFASPVTIELGVFCSSNIIKR